MLSIKQQNNILYKLINFGHRELWYKILINIINDCGRMSRLIGMSCLYYNQILTKNPYLNNISAINYEKNIYNKKKLNEYMVFNRIFIIKDNLYKDMSEDFFSKYAIKVSGAGLFGKCFGYIIMDITNKNTFNFKEIIIIESTGKIQQNTGLELVYSLRSREKHNAIYNLKYIYNTWFDLL